MTKYSTTSSKVKIGKKTIFTRCIGSEFKSIEYVSRPSEWDNVLHLGHDPVYGDVFKIWDDNSPNSFTIVFGEKGDEFND